MLDTKKQGSKENDVKQYQEGQCQNNVVSQEHEKGQDVGKGMEMKDTGIVQRSKRKTTLPPWNLL